MSDATTAADIALDVLVKEALRDVDLEQAALQNSVDAPLDKLAGTMIDADDLETEPATNPVEPAAQVVATAVVATPASQYSVVAGVAVASPTKRQKTQVPSRYVSKDVVRWYQLKIVRRAFTPHPREYGRRHVPMLAGSAPRRAHVVRGPRQGAQPSDVPVRVPRVDRPSRSMDSLRSWVRCVTVSHWCVGAARTKSVCLCNDTTVYS